MCVNVAKLSCHMRLNGDRLQSELQVHFDADLGAALEGILGERLLTMRGCSPRWLHAQSGSVYDWLNSIPLLLS